MFVVQNVKLIRSNICFGADLWKAKVICSKSRFNLFKEHQNKNGRVVKGSDISNFFPGLSMNINIEMCNYPPEDELGL